MVVACLAEVAQNMGFPIAVYVDVILLLFFWISNFIYWYEHFENCNCFVKCDIIRFSE
jgi:hypothetical protein